LLIAGDGDTAQIWVKGGRGDELGDIERERYDFLATELFYLLLQAYENEKRYDVHENEAFGDRTVHQAADFVRRYPGLKSAWLRELERTHGGRFTTRLQLLHPELAKT
jgi:hypothetical protein